MEGVLDGVLEQFSHYHGKRRGDTGRKHAGVTLDDKLHRTQWRGQPLLDDVNQRADDLVEGHLTVGALGQRLVDHGDRRDSPHRLLEGVPSLLGAEATTLQPEQ